MIELADKTVKVIISVYHMFKKLEKTLNIWSKAIEQILKRPKSKF